MSKAKRQLSAEAIEAAVTKGQPQPRKLPETLQLTKSQAVSLTALHNDEQRFIREIQDHQKAIQDRQAAIKTTKQAWVEILGEVCATHTVTLKEMDNYIFDGGPVLFRPKEKTNA